PAPPCWRFGPGRRWFPWPSPALTGCSGRFGCALVNPSNSPNTTIGACPTMPCWKPAPVSWSGFGGCCPRSRGARPSDPDGDGFWAGLWRKEEVGVSHLDDPREAGRVGPDEPQPAEPAGEAAPGQPGEEEIAETPAETAAVEAAEEPETTVPETTAEGQAEGRGEDAAEPAPAGEDAGEPA